MQGVYIVKKKFLSWILAVVSMFSCVGGFTACENPEGQPDNGGNSVVVDSGNGSTSVDNSAVSDGAGNGSLNGRVPAGKFQNPYNWNGNINNVSRNTDSVYKGTHVYTATDTKQNLVENGATKYKLIVPKSVTLPTSVSKVDTLTNVDTYNKNTKLYDEKYTPDALAVYEFIKLFKQATGITIGAAWDSNSTYKHNNVADDVKFISLGRTKQLTASGIDASKETLDNDGHIIKTIGDDIYLCGGSDEGTLYAVYTFMRLTFNYETYYYDCTEIDSVTTAKLKNYDVTDIPDFKFRAHSSDVTMYDSKVYEEDIFAWRLRYYGKDANRGYNFMRIQDEWVYDENGNPTPHPDSKSGASTNVDNWFPERLYNDPDKPEQYHPEWFSTMGGEQVCFSAHGNSESYKLMVNTAFEKVKAQLIYYNPTDYPRANIMSLTHMDNMKYCQCDACREISSYYRDSQAAVQVLFMNDLAELVDEYLKANTDKSWYREDLKLMFFAYNHNSEAPARYNATTKKYEPIDEKVKVHDRLIAWFARDASGQSKFNEGRNGEMITCLESWCALAENVYFWHYATNFSNYMIPYDSFEFATPEMFAYFCSKRDQFWFTQMQDNNPNTNTAWHNLKAYLEAKLAWDTSLNMDELMKNWFRAMYKEAASQMWDVFQSVREWQQVELVGNRGLVAYGDGNPDVVKADCWPKDMVVGWLNAMDVAKSKVSDTKTKNHIEAEALSNLYILIALHKDTQQTYIDRVTAALTDLGLKEMRISSEVDYADWVAKLSA